MVTYGEEVLVDGLKLLRIGTLWVKEGGDDQGDHGEMNRNKKFERQRMGRLTEVGNMAKIKSTYKRKQTYFTAKLYWQQKEIIRFDSTQRKITITNIP